MAQKKFNSLNWYKRTVNNKKINKKNSRSLMGFLLIWSALENLYFNNDNRLSAERLFQLGHDANEHLNPEDYVKFLQHFQERYFGKNSNGVRLFNNLFLSTEHEQLVHDATKSCKPPKDFVPALLLIANRYRNNFIHGIKEPIRIHEYEKQFNILNQFLAKFIDETKELRRLKTETVIND